MDMVENAAGKKSKTEGFITKFAKIYTPIVVIAGVLLAVVPTIIFGGFTVWLRRALVFLVASCPCALVVSIPLTFFSGLGAASRRGVLIKGSSHLQTLSTIDTVVVDKTGTVTKGEFSVTEVVGDSEAVKLAASLERFSTHPIAQAIVKYYNGEYTDFDRQEEIAGYGIAGYIGEDRILVGSLRLMKNEGIAVGDESYDIYTAKNGSLLASFRIEDTIKEDSAEAVKELKALGVESVVMLTGDRKAVAERIAKQAGITDYRAELLPQDKVTAVEELYEDSKSTGKSIAAVGDGINDAPVLARADVGVAMGGIGSDAAIEAADVVIMNDCLSRLPAAVRLARATMEIAKQNIIFVIAIKVVVLLLAALGYANMWLAIFADVGVALLAVLNSVRLVKK
jgi:Cd2+/Zn2+-exporting ATPase